MSLRPVALGDVDRYCLRADFLPDNSITDDPDPHDMRCRAIVKIFPAAYLRGK